MGKNIIHCNRSVLLLCFAIIAAFSKPAVGQLLGITGANHPELHWQELETEHFVIVYHQGLDSIAQIAAPIAEEVYHVVTTNLQTALPQKIRIYLSDNDEERNAFAFSDNYIFIWLRGILDDNLFSLRASGTSKWLRTVITHEFTHIVIAKATRTWVDAIIPVPKVPRWFNEGMARYMEPDGWTNDLDIPLRVSAVSSKLDFNPEEFLAGTLIYEAGQSLVRYMAATYGDSALVKMLKHREPSFIPYDFNAAVKAATKHSLHEIYDEWHKTLNVYYNTQFGQKEDIEDIARKIPTGLDIVGAARIASDGKRIAILGKKTQDEPTKLFLLANDTSGDPKLITGEPGIEPYLTWAPDGKYLFFSKIRFGDHGNLVYDLYQCDVKSGDLERISSDERLEYPDISPDGKTIVAAQFRRSGSDLVLLDLRDHNLREVTNFHDDNVDIYSPRWSPDGKKIAFSIFRKNGMRDVAVLDTGTRAITYLTNDSINDRYPIWSPNGDSIVFLSFQNSIPNLYSLPISQSSSRHPLTDVASNILVWDWSKVKDSLLVSSFISRNEVQLFWLTSQRSILPSSPLPLSAKYTKWREVRWPLVTRPQDSIPPVSVAGPYPYNSLAHIRPLALLPIVGSDLSRDGNSGVELGGFTVLSDEMQKHIISGFAYYGTASQRVSWGANYANSQLLPTITVAASDAVEFQDVLNDIAYYEHRKTYDLGINFFFHTPNSLIDLHNIVIGASWNNLEPWNAANFDSVTIDRRPLPARMLEMGAGYSYLGEVFQFRLAGEHSDKNLGSDLTRTRVRASMHKEFPYSENAKTQLAFIGRAAADFGDELPQDFLGFYKYDQFEEGFSPTGLHPRDRLRGIRRYYYGNRLLSGSMEFRQEDNFFSSLVPLLKNFHPQLVEFLDIGTTWYASAPTNNPSVTVSSLSETNWLKTAGIELRSELGFDISVEGGVGWELVHGSSADFFIRLAAF